MRSLGAKGAEPLLLLGVGVLNTYRPKGQTSWSKALVRHGAGAGGRCWECPRRTFGRGVP